MAVSARDEKILIAYDKLRYHLLPYIYSIAWQVTTEGSTMMRGLVMDFQHDPQVCNSATNTSLARPSWSTP